MARDRRLAAPELGRHLGRRGHRLLLDLVVEVFTLLLLGPGPLRGLLLLLPVRLRPFPFLPSFRPLSFLSNLAERVLPTEADMAGSTNGHSTIPTPAVAPPLVAPPALQPEPPAADPEPPEAEPIVLDASPEEADLPEAGVPGTVGPEAASELGADPSTQALVSELAADEPASGSVPDETPRG